MEHNKNKKRRRWDGRAALFAIMIGFCILAVIEIAYGQAKLKVEKERLALEETNYQTLQALEKAQEDAQSESIVLETEAAASDSSFMSVVEKDTKETEQAEENEQPEQNDIEDDIEDDREYDMQIVFMGDSVIDLVREDNGIAALVGNACNAKVYNMAMGGTTAALLPGEQAEYSKWDSRCLLGVVNAILGNIDSTIFNDYDAGWILEKCDFSKTDYFVIEYGVNDFMAQIPASRYLENGETRKEDAVHTYAGALDCAVNLLRDAFPDAKIILIAPHYCQFFNGETFVGDGYSLDYGYGNLINYARACGYIAEQYKEDGVMFYNAFEESGIDAYTADEYLEDGIHLTSAGRRSYVEHIIWLIRTDFYPEE